ncbi:hypothetical protein XENTR_v10013164 [Xenopus tropicalis]|nr:hypothetical protein XENTR_v10013164 [Xenopus tropicalis]
MIFLGRHTSYIQFQLHFGERNKGKQRESTLHNGTGATPLEIPKQMKPQRLRLTVAQNTMEREYSQCYTETESMKGTIPPGTMVQR